MESRPVFRVTEVLGANMDCLDAAEVGHIAELVVGAGTRRILYVVVKPHARLGNPATEYLAVPWAALSRVGVGNGATHYRVPMPLTRLRRAPTFSPDRWPDFGSSREMAEVHSFFGEPPSL
jgi:hypothetical protein